VNDDSILAIEFDAKRPHLSAVAYRLLGSTAEAEDAVQEAWMRLSRSDRSEVDNLGGWLTTVVARICLDMLRSRTSRREESMNDALEIDADRTDSPAQVESEMILAENMSAALIVVLETLSPPERLAFVLHDLFGLPFGEIGAVLGRSPVATRQLASRARRRIQGQTASDRANNDRIPNREVVEAFLAASRNGDFAALLALLAPDVVLDADAAAVRMGAATDVRGADAVAKTFVGRARAAEVALIGGEPGLVWATGGMPRVAFRMTIRGGQISAISMVADADSLRTLGLIPNGGGR
jgi:RNA polymerase sigma-70 factor (ECF subfamily)